MAKYRSAFDPGCIEVRSFVGGPNRDKSCVRIRVEALADFNLSALAAMAFACRIARAAVAATEGAEGSHEFDLRDEEWIRRELGLVADGVTP